jgi:putative spermidine/putrescine transport system permease protein
VADAGRRVGISTEAAPQALRPDLVSGRRRLPLAWVATLPFFAYATAFLFIPAASVMIGAFQDKHDHATVSNIRLLFHHPYVDAYWGSIRISLVTAALGCIVGLFVAYAAVRDGTPRWIRSVLTTFSGVAANFGGIPLAFAFIATLGPLGVVTMWFRNAGYDITYQTPHFQISSERGIEVAYMYFQLPLMILVIAPALDGLKREWREAASNLGARGWQFWRHVGIPVLMPSFLGAFILLFGNAFAAYATAYSLDNGINIVPILIGDYYTGNVLDNPHIAQALAFGMFAVLALMMVAYIPLQRRAARWAK